MDFQIPTSAKKGALSLSYQLSRMWSRRGRGKNEVSKLSYIEKTKSNLVYKFILLSCNLLFIYQLQQFHFKKKKKVPKSQEIILVSRTKVKEKVVLQAASMPWHQDVISLCLSETLKQDCKDNNQSQACGQRLKQYRQLTLISPS